MEVKSIRLIANFKNKGSLFQKYFVDVNSALHDQMQ